MLAFANVAVQLPILIAVVVGAIVVLTRASRLPRRTVTLAKVGLGVTVVNVVLGAVWMIVSPYLAIDLYESSDSMSIGLMYFVASIVLNLVAAVGLLLSFLAVAAAARPADPPAV